MPAFFCGVFGHKPSPSIVSNHGQWPMPKGQVQSSYLGLGPMSRFACDLKPMLQIISGKNAQLALDEPVDLRKLNYFYQEDNGGSDFVSPVDQDIHNALHKVIDHFRNALQVQPQHVQISKLKQSVSIWLANMKDKDAVCFEYELANLNGRINPYLEMFKWFIGQSNHTFIAIMTALTDRHGIQCDSPEHQLKRKEKAELYKEFDEMLGTNGVFIYPTHPTVAPYHNEPIARAFNFSYTAIVNTLGLPATAIPLGIGSEGLPIGLQVIANRNQDRLCLAVACELERAFGGWTPSYSSNHS